MYPGTCTFEFKFVQQVKDKNMGEGELGISAKEEDATRVSPT